MSGIAGAIADDGDPLDPHIAARMIAAAPVRGFDGTTWWQDGPACLIRHHHATTPQAIGEMQPLRSGSGGIVAMLDGRIDNREEIIDLLARADCREWTPDVALVLALFERFGEGCVTRLVGDWALAMWRTDDRSLFLARSPMGWRPLMWSHANGVFAFSTEPRALLKGLGLDHAPNEGVVGEFLSVDFTTRTETLWNAVQQVVQGGAMRIARGTIRRWQWHDAFDPIDERLSDVDHIDRFAALFDQAIVATSRSNTPVSAHLSGGLDSSSIVTRAIELHRAGRIDRPVQAISARFPGLAHDETRWSRAVEEKLGITARVTGTVPYSFDEAAAWSADTYQLPVRPNVFDVSVASFRLLEQQGGRVLLTGEGGDEWMADGVAPFADLLRRGRFADLVRRGIAEYPGDPLWRRLGRAAYWGIAPNVSDHHRRQIMLMAGSEAPIRPWIAVDWAERIGLADRFATAMPSTPLASHVQRRRYANFDLGRRFVDFSNITALAERHGVEMRHPFHDLRLTHFFMTAAPRMLQRRGVRKRILREAMDGSLPEIVRTRLDKAEFSHGIVSAAVRRLRDRPVETMLPVRLGWLDADDIRTKADILQRASDHPIRAVHAAQGPIWFAVSLDLWLENATAGWADAASTR